MWTYWINVLDAIWQSTVIFFVAYFTYTYHINIDSLSFGFSIATSMILVSMVHVCMQTSRIDTSLIATIALSLLIFFGFTLVFDATCVMCLNGYSPHKVSYSTLSKSIFWLTNLFTIITAMLPRYIVKCVYNSTENPLLKSIRKEHLPSATEVTRF